VSVSPAAGSEPILTGDGPAPATLPPEQRGSARHDVRLLVSGAHGHRHARFLDLPAVLTQGDLLVVNDSATIPASLPANGPLGRFRLNLSTCYAERLWLAEPRRSHAEPGPLPIVAGSVCLVGTARPVRVRFVAPHPGLPRLWFVASERSLTPTVAADGEPIHYAYLQHPQPLTAYQSLFARLPGSAEMPSAARPFTEAVLVALRERGVEVATVTLHAGVSSLELEPAEPSGVVLYGEPFEVSARAAAQVNATRQAGGRVIAVGTTVVRALETAWASGGVHAMRGFTRRYVHPADVRGAVDGLLTGFHEPASTHLALLTAVAGGDLVREAYREALDRRYLWHEFGDSHLLLPGRPRRAA